MPNGNRSNAKLLVVSSLIVNVLFAISTTSQAAGIASACPGQLPIQMHLEPTGSISALLTVNGIAARFLVDSGANRNTLDSVEGKRLKADVTTFPNSPRSSEATMKVATGMTSLGSQNFALMSLDFINVPTKQFGGTPYTGQLGASFFIEYKAKIDFANMVLCITAPESGR